MRDFAHLHEWGEKGVAALVEKALAFKKRPLGAKPLAGKSVALCFMNPSLRTLVSFEVATASLGGHPVVISPGSSSWKMEWREGTVMDGDCSEHLKEAVPILSRYCSIVALRSFPEGKSWEEDKKEPYLAAFRRYSTVPVINMESALGHPCQALADRMTIQERMNPKGKNFLLTWAPHIKGLPMAVPHSAVEMAAMAGMNVTIARPPGFDLAPEVLKRVEKNCRLTITDDPQAAFKGAHVVYAKSWGSLAAYGKPPPAEPDFRKKWIVTQKKMKLTDKAIFMHCLPVRRNLVVEDAVLDAAYSVVTDEAENRLHAAKAVLDTLVRGEK